MTVIITVVWNFGRIFFLVLHSLMMRFVTYLYPRSFSQNLKIHETHVMREASRTPVPVMPLREPGNIHKLHHHKQIKRRLNDFEMVSYMKMVLPSCSRKAPRPPFSPPLPPVEHDPPVGNPRIRSPLYCSSISKFLPPLLRFLVFCTFSF